MPPNFQREGIDACKEIRKRHPGTGVVILSQYDDPDYAISLLSEGAAGYAYLLKDRIAEGDQLARAIREVATGGSMLDPAIVERARAPGAGLERAVRRRRQPAVDGRRGQADQGHRRLPPDDAVRGGRRRRAPVRQPGQGRVRRRRPGPAPPPPALRGHRRAGGAGRDAEPPAARRRGRAPAAGRHPPRRDGVARGHGAHVGHPRLLDDRRARRPRRARAAAQHAIAAR